MNKSKFDTIVKNRAQQRVEARIATFRQEIYLAFLKLAKGTEWKVEAHYFNYIKPEALKVISENICYSNGGVDTKNNWPTELWKAEESFVSNELLATMDEMSKALSAPDVAINDNTPRPIEEVKIN